MVNVNHAPDQIIQIEFKKPHFSMYSLFYFISRIPIMSDHFADEEPMDIEGEAVCAVGIQSVMAEGEQRAGADVKRTSYHPEANNLLNLD